jgi:hypothetical protein
MAVLWEERTGPWKGCLERDYGDDYGVSDAPQLMEKKI